MKPIRFSTLLAMMAIIIAACSSQAEKQHVFPVSNDNILCPANIAQQDIRYLYDLHDSDSANNSFVKDLPIAFTIRAMVLFAAMGMPYDSACSPYTHVRVYAGYRVSDEAGTGSQKGFKLYVVPVRGVSAENPSGNDGLLEQSGKGYAVVKPDAGRLGKQYVLDLNAPCPSTCDRTSPLYPEKN